MHRAHHGDDVVGAGDREHLRMGLPHDIAFGAEAAGDDHLAVFPERFADRVERLIDRRVDEAAGIDNHQVGVAIAGRDPIAFCAQLREDALGVHERLGAP
jgi:hypothetical protein